MSALAADPDDPAGGSGAGAGADLDGPGGEFDTAQYVTFEMAGERYAFPMDQVREIIRVPVLVRVPLAPQTLVGIANLRGRVLPVVNLRTCCGLPSVDNDETTRVVVVDSVGTVVGLIVDRVTSVVSVEPAMVEPGASVQSTVRSYVLSALVRTPGGMVTALDVDRILQSQFRLSASATGARDGCLAPPAAASAGEDDTMDAVELVSFAVDGQEYALPIDRVREIVQAPETVSRVPNSSDRVMGVMDLRGKLLPVLSMRKVFGLPDTELAPTHRIVVVALDGARTVGVVTDDVREVLRVPSALVDPLPRTVAASGRATEVESVCRLAEGSRLVSVLSLDRLFSDSAWAEELDGCVQDPAGNVAHEEGDGEMTDDADRRGEELLVVFRLDGEQYAVDVDRVQEIIRVPETLIRVPNAEQYVDGLVNLRGTVLPVVDLRSRLGLDRVERDERQRIVVFTLNGVRTGFIVDSVVEVARVPRQALEPAPDLADGRATVVSQVANLTAQNRMLLVVDADQLLGVELSGHGTSSGSDPGSADQPELVAVG